MATRTLVYSPGMGFAAYYEDDALVRAGDTDVVLEWLVERLGVETKCADFIIDKSARGWDGVALSLAEVPA